MSKTDKKLRAISLILVAVLVFTALFNVVYLGSAISGNSPVSAPSAAAAGNTFEKTDLNLDSIREQYFNQEIIQKNIASYDGDRWVIVELSGNTLYDKFKASSRYSDFTAYATSVEGQKAQAAIKAEHTEFLNKLERHGIDYQVSYTYTAITNAVAVKVNADAYNSIRQMSGVVDAYYTEYYDVPKVVVENNANVYTTGIYDTEGIEEAGEGMVVAILDTGLDYTHEAFQDMPTNGRLTKTDIENAVNATNGSGAKQLLAVGTADDFYYNAKVPFAYDYADDDANVYPSYSSHGTHVAGIVAGKSDYVVDEESGETFVGVAPQAQLVICKVFTDDLDSKYLGGANTMSILAALNDCTVLGVDVINMSLGTSAGFSEERGDSAQTVFLNSVYNRIEELGISLVVAASNDYSSGYGGGYGTNLASNPDSGTVGSPSTYSAALSVASINGRKSSYIAAMVDSTKGENNEDNPVAFITNSSNEYGQEFDFVDLLYSVASETRGETVKKGDTLKFKYVPVGGTGASSDYTSILRQFDLETAKREGFDGVIALVRRGTTSFAEKIQMAMGAGAQACIVYNNVAGTIRMSLGDIDDPIPACSISMDAGNAFVAAAAGKQYGTLYVNSEYLAGPFMSEFSSWGPTPDLQLKPEITAHGGEIISAVASGYDKLSGTSMAAPNMAGAIALLRQHLQSRDEYKNLSGKELNSLVNQMLMSTATIAMNEENNPYSPRKQGAGLAGIADAINAEGYITVLDENNNERDKTKIELYDTSKKTGIYVLDFVMHNITGDFQSYNPVTYVMTETMSSDGKTVAEKAYMLNSMCTIQYYIGRDANSLSPNDGTVTVAPNSTLAVRVVITLNDQAKKYLDDNFVNGMYVEGFVSMQGVDDTKVTLGVPYLGFYGTWTDAPLFDYDVYEIAEDDQTEEDEYKKIKASAAATMVTGMYYEDKYVFPLGTYIYSQSEDDVTIYPSRDKIAVSMFDDSMGHSIYELYMVYAGLLRGAAEMEVVITDDATGSVIYRDTLNNVRKSYSAGGANYGAPISLELKPGEWGLKNNSTYSVSVTGKLDYEGGENPERASFEFPFTVDYEEPEMLDYRIRYMPYTENKVVKYRIYMDVDVRDNHYVSAVLPCYIKTRPTGLGTEEEVITTLTQYAVPVSGLKGETSTVSFEITDIYEDYVKKGLLYVQVEDYAFNASSYRIVLGQWPGENAMGDPESIEFITDDYLKKGQMSVDSFGTSYYNYTLTLAPYTLYTFNAITNPSDAVLQSLTWSYGTNTDNHLAKAYGNELFTGASGRETLILTNTNMSEDGPQKTYAVVDVFIRGTAGSEPILQSIMLNSVLNGSGYITSLNPAGSAVPELELNPNQTLKLTYTWEPWYCDEPDVTWSSDAPNIVSVTDDGTISALSRGTAYITVTSVDRPSVRKTIKVVVGREYSITSYTLYDFYGVGEIEIPSNLNIMYISEDCFKGRTDITKVILPTTLTELPENAFLGCTNLEEVVIPGQCTTIKANAFAGCTSLNKISLGLFVDSDKNILGEDYAGTLTIGRNAFKGCVNLKYIENQERITTINQGAFEGCTSLESIDLTNLRVVANGAFKGCTSLSSVTTSKDTVLGIGMFENCTSLVSFDFNATAIPSDIFSGCTRLSTVNFSQELTSIGSNAFRGTAIVNFKLPDGNISIEANAFRSSSLTTLTLSAGTVLAFANNTPFTSCNSFNAYAIDGVSGLYSVVDGVLYNSDKTELIAVPYAKTSFTLPGSVNAIAGGALSGVNVASIDLSNVTNIGSYVFAGNTSITTVTLPSGLTEIPAGLFDGCTKLVTVTAGDNFESVTKIGQNAFRGCTQLKNLKAQNVEVIGDSAFEDSGLTELPGNKIVSVGDSAFAGSKLKTVNLPDCKVLSRNAFASISTLTTVVLGAVEKMEYGVFVDSDQITSVAFGAGTVEIGEAAFGSNNASSTAMTVTLPSSVKTIASFAFYNRGGITINLGSVEYIGAFAFAYENENGTAGGIAVADLASVKEIGAAAFINSRLRSVNLPNAVVIEDSAFGGSTSLASVTFGKLERLGVNAFYSTILTTVTLPSSFNSRTYVYEWDVLDEKNNVEDTKARNELAYGAGAFMAATLKEIKVAAGNDVFFDVDGVLYSKVENGYVLEQYPVAKPGSEYKVIDNTVLINDRAFEHVENLTKVELPYTVSTIGSLAFFDSNVVEYTFNSVEAPTLLSSYTTPSDVQGDQNLEYFYTRVFGSGAGLTNFYANFFYYVLYRNSAYWSDETNEFIDEWFNIKMTIPLNAKGYDGVWEMFFMTVEHTENNMPDNTSHKAIEAIEKLIPYESQISSLSYGAINSESELGKLAAAARAAYNLIVAPEQVELMAEYFNTLTRIESALRSRKAALGYPVSIKELVQKSAPTKLRYVEGETFDTTGMMIVAVYDDGSEVVLAGDNYTLSPSVLTSDTKYVVITYYDEVLNQSVSLSVRISVSASSSSNGGDNESGNSAGNGGSLSGGAIAGIVIGVILGVGLIAGAVVVVILLNKKKSANGENKNAEAADKTAESDTESVDKKEEETVNATENQADSTENASEASKEGSETESAQTEATEEVAENENTNNGDAELSTADSQSVADKNDEAITDGNSELNSDKDSNENAQSEESGAEENNDD